MKQKIKVESDNSTIDLGKEKVEIHTLKVGDFFRRFTGAICRVCAKQSHSGSLEIDAIDQETGIGMVCNTKELVTPFKGTVTITVE